MELRPLDRTALRRVYKAHIVSDFPPEERKPLWVMERLRVEGAYHTLGLYDGATLLAYACLWIDPQRDGVLLDYLAVCDGGRGQGTGSALMAMLADRYRDYPGIFAEAEAPDDAKPEVENALRRRRIDFYLQTGFRLLDYQVLLYDVHYVVLGTHGLDSAGALAAHKRHYRWDSPLHPRLPHSQIPYEKS